MTLNFCGIFLIGAIFLNNFVVRLSCIIMCPEVTAERREGDLPRPYDKRETVQR